MKALDIPCQAPDGHAWTLLARVPDAPSASLLWLPALGVAARHYLPFAEDLAGRGIAVFLHEWRGHGTSSLRAGHRTDWGYRELLVEDLPTSESAVAAAVPGTVRVLGGHSIGGQLACCRLALAPTAAGRLWLVASGAPYWRAFPLARRWWLPLVYRFLPWLADRFGALPGRRIGFGGQEARGVMRDWARTGLSGRYAGRGITGDIEAGLRRLDVSADAVVLSDDWLAPPSSLRYLLGKMPRVDAAVHAFDAGDLRVDADHFSWLRAPATVSAALASSVSAAAPRGAAPPGS